MLCDRLGVSERWRARSPGSIAPRSGARRRPPQTMRRCAASCADDLLDDGVLAVLSLNECDVLGAVGGEGEVAPLPKQLALGGSQSDAAHDQATARQDGLGDLRLTRLGVVLQGLPVARGIAATSLVTGLVILTPIENCQPFSWRRSKTRVFQKPESARSRHGPVAPARRTRAISSSQKRPIPRWVFAAPFLKRTCKTSPLPARVAISG